MIYIYIANYFIIMIIIYLYACLYVGWGVDQEVIIWILGHRKAVQRKKIKETYQQLFKESIIHCLQSTLSGVLGVLCFHILLCFNFMNKKFLTFNHR